MDRLVYRPCDRLALCCADRVSVWYYWCDRLVYRSCDRPVLCCTDHVSVWYYWSCDRLVYRSCDRLVPWFCDPLYLNKRCAVPAKGTLHVCDMVYSPRSLEDHLRPSQDITTEKKSVSNASCEEDGQVPGLRYSTHRSDAVTFYNLSVSLLGLLCNRNGFRADFLCLLLLRNCRRSGIVYVSVVWVRINKWSCINIRNQ